LSGKVDMELKTNKNRMTVANAFGRLSRFRDDEDGGMIIFSLILFVLILTFGGMAVDLMRFETTRAQLQGTLDRATLAAADLDQTEDPATIVEDYFTKAGMIDFLDGAPIVDEGINYRIVTANASAEMPLFFYDLPRVFMSPFTSGLTSLTVTGASTAEDIAANMLFTPTHNYSNRRCCSRCTRPPTSVRYAGTSESHRSDDRWGEHDRI